MDKKSTQEELAEQLDGDGLRISKLETALAANQTEDYWPPGHSEFGVALLNATTEAAFLIDSVGRILALNKVIAERLGKSIPELLGKIVYDYVPTEVAERRKPILDGVFRTGEPVRFEDERSGRVIDNSVYPVFDSNRNVVAVAVFAKDVTDRKCLEQALQRANEDLERRVRERTSELQIRTEELANEILEHELTEEALRKSEARFRAIYENAPIMINAFAPNGELILWNRELEKRLGWSRKETQSSDPLALCYPDPQMYRQAKETIARADGKFREFNPVDKDGALHTQLWANFRLPDGSVISVGHDITELRRSELRGQLEKERFEALAQYAPFGLVMMNEEGKYLYVNPKFEELFGYDPAEIRSGREFCRMAFPDSDYRHEVISLWKKDLEKAEVGELRPRIFRVKCKDGTYKEILFRPVQLDSGEHLMTCGDVTERQRAEEELKRALELSMRLRQEAEAANTAKSRFLSNMSHEIRTPLNAVIGFSQILEDGSYGDLNEKQLKFIRHIAESGQHLLQLINEILDLAKVESGKMILQSDYVNLDKLLGSSLLMVEQKARQKGLRLEVDIEAGLSGMNVKADEVKMRQIIFNLLSNATKFTPDGGRILLKVASFDDSLIVSVSDSGIGFRPEDKERIFEAFEQLDSALDRHHDGTGLGLALTRRLVELHGGRICAQSAGPGRGSTFSFAIPMEKRG